MQSLMQRIERLWAATIRPNPMECTVILCLLAIVILTAVQLWSLLNSQP